MQTALATVRKIHIRTISDKNMGGDYHRPYKFDFSCFRVGKVKKKSHYLLVIGAVGTAGGTKRTGGDGNSPNSGTLLSAAQTFPLKGESPAPTIFDFSRYRL